MKNNTFGVADLLDANTGIDKEKGISIFDRFTETINSGPVTISVACNKGGVGKSHSVQNIGAIFAMLGFRVLVVDTDSQISLSNIMLGNNEAIFDGVDIRDGVKTLYHALSGKAEPQECIQTVHYEKARRINRKNIQVEFDVDIIPGSKYVHLALNGKNIKTVNLTGEYGNTFTCQYGEDVYMENQMMDKVRNDYDIIMIDCPPTRNALIDINDLNYAASDFIISPLNVDNEAAKGFAELNDAVRELAESGLEFVPNILGTYFAHVNKSSAEKKAFLQSYQEYKETLGLFDTVVSDTSAAGNTSSDDSAYMPLCIRAPRCATELDYERLSFEIMERICNYIDELNM